MSGLSVVSFFFKKAISKVATLHVSGELFKVVDNVVYNITHNNIIRR